jgi:hypothetical protein
VNGPSGLGCDPPAVCYLPCIEANEMHLYNIRIVAVSLIKGSVAGLSPRRPEFAPCSDHVGYVMDKVALEQVSLRFLRFYPVSIIPP